MTAVLKKQQKLLPILWIEIIWEATFQLVATFHLPSPAALLLCLLVASLTEVKQLASLPDSALSSLPFNQIRSLER